MSIDHQLYDQTRAQLDSNMKDGAEERNHKSSLAPTFKFRSYQPRDAYLRSHHTRTDIAVELILEDEKWIYDSLQQLISDIDSINDISLTVDTDTLNADIQRDLSSKLKPLYNQTLLALRQLRRLNHQKNGDVNKEMGSKDSEEESDDEISSEENVIFM